MACRLSIHEIPIPDSFKKVYPTQIRRGKNVAPVSQRIRTSKTVTGTTHYYTLNGSQILTEQWGNIFIVYLYDESGSPIGMQYRTNSMAEGTFYTYLFEKNLQGDIIAVYNQSGTKLISYYYDAWGNFVKTTHNLSGTNVGAQYNPFLYRGYYYDTELGFYYLQSRYYDPAVGRFINADGITTIAATPNGLYDKNLYSYCDNNPVMRKDDGGEFWHIVVGSVVGAVANFASSVITNHIKGEKVDLGAAFISAGIGAIEGGLSAAGAPLALVVGFSAGLSAAESVYNDFKENICDNGTNTVGDIIVHATISAGVSALFTASGGQSNGRELSKMYKAARSAKKSLKAKGLHPTVKNGFNNAISTYSKEFGKFTKDCLIDAGISTPFSTFSSEYTIANYDHVLGG